MFKMIAGGVLVGTLVLMAGPAFANGNCGHGRPAHDNRCDVNHPREGHDWKGHHNPDCSPATTVPTTVPVTVTTEAPTTTVPVVVTTVPESTTVPTIVVHIPETTTTVAGPTITTVPETSTTVGSATSTTVLLIPPVTVIADPPPPPAARAVAAPASSLPRTGSSSGLWALVAFGLVGAGGALLLVKRGQVR